MIVVFLGCLSENDAFQRSRNIVLWRSRMEMLSKGELFGDITWYNEKMSCEEKE